MPVFGAVLQNESEEEEEKEDGDGDVQEDEEVEKDLYRLTVPALKERLKAMGQLVGGRKQDLIDRLTRAMDEATQEADEEAQEMDETRSAEGQEQGDWDDEARSHRHRHHP